MAGVPDTLTDALADFPTVSRAALGRDATAALRAGDAGPVYAVES